MGEFVMGNAEAGSDQETREDVDRAAPDDLARAEFLQITVARLLIKNQAMRFELLAARERIARLEWLLLKAAPVVVGSMKESAATSGSCPGQAPGAI
jgi:hypothetical protein